MENARPAPITKGPQDGENLSVVGDTYRILITGKETGGAFAYIALRTRQISQRTFFA
jgi:hypothetical protein